MKRSTKGMLFTGVLTGSTAIVIAFHNTERAPIDRGGMIIGDSATSASRPMFSTRKAETVAASIGSSPRKTQDDLLAGIAAPPPPSGREVVEDQIAEKGPRAVAEAVRNDLILLTAEKNIHIEEVARQWSLDHPQETWSWIEDQMEDAKGDSDFNQAAISGYIESIVLLDPEAAVNAADLLDPTLPEPDLGSQTRPGSLSLQIPDSLGKPGSSRGIANSARRAGI